MVHSGCVVFKIHVLKGKIKHLSKYWGSSTQDDPCRSNIGGSRPLQPLRRWRLCARRYRLIAAGADLQAPALSSKHAGRRCCCRSMAQTDGRTDDELLPLRIVRGCVNNFHQRHDSVTNRQWMFNASQRNYHSFVVSVTPNNNENVTGYL